MKRSWINRSTPEKIREWERRSKPLANGRPPKRKPSKLSRSPLAKIGQRRKRMRKEGTLFGDVFDWLLETVGECQGKGELPGECGRILGRKPLERCHALTRNSGRYDWTDDPATGERVCNGLILCPVHHSMADDNKADWLDWMRRKARENGERYDGE